MNKKIVATIGLAVLLCSLFAGAPFYTMDSSVAKTMTTDDTISTQQDETARRPGGTISTSIGFAVDNTFHPLGQETTSTISLMSYMYDPLVARNPFQPAALDKETGMMAKSFNYTLIDATGDNAITLRNGTEITDNTTSVWTVELRHGYYWHDGAEITADDITFTYQFFQWVQNHYDAATTGMGQMEYYKAVKEDKYTFKVYTGREGFETSRYSLYLAPVPKHIYERASTWKDGATGTFNISNQWAQDWDVTGQEIGTYIPTLPNDPVLTGSGPWTLSLTDASYPPNVRTFLLERNTNYYWNPYNEDGEIAHEWKYFDDPAANNETIWDPCQGEVGNPYLYGPYADRLKVSLITEETLEWQAFRQGGLSFAQGTSVTRHLAEVQTLDLPLYQGAEWGMNSLHFFADSANYFAGKPKFRRAMDWALDKYNIINEHRNGYGYALNDPITSPPWGPEWNWEANDDRRDQNVEKARELLLDMEMIQADGPDDDNFVEYATNGSNIKPINLIWIKGYNKPVGTLSERYMEEAGVPVEPRGVPMSRAWELTGTPECHACPYGWGAGPIPSSLLILWAKPIVGWSEYGYYNQTYADAIETMLSARSIEDAYDAAHTAQEYFFKDVPSIPMFRDVVLSTWHNDKWEGVVTGTDSYLDTGFSSRFMIQKGEAKASEGFSLQQNAKVKGTVNFGTTVTDIVSELVQNASESNISWIEVSIDGRSPSLADYEVLNVEPLGNFSVNIEFEWDYELDTTDLENGRHQLVLRVFGLTGDPLEYYLLFNVDNSVPFTQRVVPMAAVSSVISAVVVGALVYMVLERKKPPAE